MRKAFEIVVNLRRTDAVIALVLPQTGIKANARVIFDRENKARKFDSPALDASFCCRVICEVVRFSLNVSDNLNSRRKSGRQKNTLKNVRPVEVALLPMMPPTDIPKERSAK